MQIYTSYFGSLRNLEKSGIVPISIALWKPKWYRGACYYPVAPKPFMLNGRMSDEEYVINYKLHVLAKLDVTKVLKEIEWLSGGKDAALLCYEKPGDFCHRHLLAEWIVRETGLDVCEWSPSRTEKEEEDDPTLF